MMNLDQEDEQLRNLVWWSGGDRISKSGGDKISKSLSS